MEITTKTLAPDASSQEEGEVIFESSSADDEQDSDDSASSFLSRSDRGTAAARLGPDLTSTVALPRTDYRDSAHKPRSRRDTYRIEI